MRLKDIKLNMIANTSPTFVISNEGGNARLINEYNVYSGLIARNCVSTKSFDEILSEDVSKSLKRAENVKASGHHSVFEHEYLTFEIQNLSKAFAMIINNEKAYNTTEKSMRYTANYDNMTSEESQLYAKWQGYFADLIERKYKNDFSAFFTEEKIKKLSQENARYLLSVYTPTSLIYSASLRQLNYLYGFMKKELEKDKTNIFYAQLKPSFESFCEGLEKFGIIDEHLIDDNKSRSLSLYNEYNATPYFGDVYSTNDKASFAYLAQAQRHRTINYSFNLPKYNCYYMPPILENSHDKMLASEWVQDCKLAQEFTSEDIEHNLIQSNLVNVTEQGTLDNFILKMKERKCTFAQLEINQKTNEILNNYVTALDKSGHPRAEESKAYQKGARCTFPTYKCTNKCGFPLGVNETREI